MERAEILLDVRRELALITDTDEESITAESRLVDDLDADSLDLLQLVVALRDDYGIEIEEGEVKRLLTELARFLPEASLAKQDLDESEVAEVTNRLRVDTIVSFVEDRLEKVVS